MDDIVKINNLSVGYRRKPIVSGISARLRPGHIYGLLGRNGAGKTTLLRTLAGAIPPLGGETDFMGMDPFGRPERFLSECYLVETSVSLPSLRPHTFVDVYAPFYPRFSVELYSTLAGRLGVNPALPLSRQSTGEQRRFILAFALACRCAATLLDEPFTGLDIIARGEMLRAIATGDNPDSMMIVSSHDTLGLENIITDLMVIDRGAMILDAPVDMIASAVTCHHEGRWPDTLYADGLASITVNPDGIPSTLDLPLLFKALVTDSGFPSTLHNLISRLSCTD